MMLQETIHRGAGKRFEIHRPTETLEVGTAPDPSVLRLQPELAWGARVNDLYECEVWVEEEADGVFVAFAARLPGVVAQGDDLDQALDEIKQAVTATLASYIDRDEPIPWTAEPIESDRDRSITKRWLLVEG